jgi:uncharacterized protein
MNRALIASFVFFTAIATGTGARAFDCSQAKTVTEKAICKSSALTVLDRQLNAAYRAALAARPGAQAEPLKQVQRAWLKENDATCSGAEDCLKRRYEERIAALSQTAPLAEKAAVSGTLTYKTVTVKKTKPYELSLSYPKFDGTPAEAAAFLNAFVKKQLPSCDGDGPAGKAEMSYIGSTFEVRKLSDDVAVINEAGESYCAGAAHPNHGSSDRFIALKHKTEVNLFEGIGEAAKQDLTARLAAAGKDIAADDECKELFAPDNLKDSFLAFKYKDGRDLIIRPSFPHVAQACETAADATIPIADLEKYYAGQPAALAVLNGLKR